MLTPPIPRNLPSEEMVIALINRDNNLSLTDSDVTVSDARNNPTPTLIEGTPYYRDTTAMLKAVYGGDFKSSTRITYRRLNANVIFGDVSTVFRPSTQTHTVDILPELNALYGLALQASDIINEPLDFSALPVTFTIKFVNDNPAWHGTIDITIKDSGYRLDEYVLSRILPVLRYPTGQVEKIQGDLYIYGRAFTRNAEVISALTPSTPLDPLLPVINSAVQPDQWVIRSSENEFNLYDAQVIYNGKATSVYTTRTEFTNVMIVQLGPLCTNIVGKLYFHYNV